MHYNLPELWRPQNCLSNSAQFWMNWNLLMSQWRKSSHLPPFHFSHEVQSSEKGSCLPPSWRQFPEKKWDKKPHICSCSFSENVKAVQNLVLYSNWRPCLLNKGFNIQCAFSASHCMWIPKPSVFQEIQVKSEQQGWTVTVEDPDCCCCYFQRPQGGLLRHLGK